MADTFLRNLVSSFNSFQNVRFVPGLASLKVYIAFRGFCPHRPLAEQPELAMNFEVFSEGQIKPRIAPQDPYFCGPHELKHGDEPRGDTDADRKRWLNLRSTLSL